MELIIQNRKKKRLQIYFRFIIEKKFSLAVEILKRDVLLMMESNAHN